MLDRGLSSITNADPDQKKNVYPSGSKRPRDDLENLRKAGVGSSATLARIGAGHRPRIPAIGSGNGFRDDCRRLGSG